MREQKACVIKLPFQKKLCHFIELQNSFFLRASPSKCGNFVGREQKWLHDHCRYRSQTFFGFNSISAVCYATDCRYWRGKWWRACQMFIYDGTNWPQEEYLCNQQNELMELLLCRCSKRVDRASDQSHEGVRPCVETTPAALLRNGVLSKWTYVFP